MDRTSDRPNWVAARADCTIFGTFEKIDDAIGRDVRCFNSLKGEKGEGREYTCSDSGNCVMAVTNNYNRDEIMVRLNGDSVEILKNGVLQFAVSQKWNGETLDCHLFTDGKPTCLWKISQRAIGDFMFPESATT